MIKFNKDDKVLSNIARIISERQKDGRDLTLVIDESLGEYDGKFEDGVITAGSHSQILDIAGRYLRHPDMKNCTIHSHKQMSGLYFASHNHNYYEMAPIEEIYHDIDDLALWGMNVLQVWFDMFQHSSMEDGKEYAERVATLLKYAKSIGVKTSLVGPINEAFNNSPEELRADWTSGHDGYVMDLNDHYHVEICPSKPGGIEKMVEYRREYLEVFRDVQPDYFVMGCYDEGGCTCPDCAPWGGNGYIRCCEAIIPLLKEYWPNVKPILSTWYFGVFREPDDFSEFELLNKAIKEGRLSECVYINSEPNAHMYPYTHEMALPLIGFPEISMCGLAPWGGYGTNPTPKRLQRHWDNCGDKQEGGTPYCEGFFEDINKVIMLRFYRENQSASDTIKEYLTYEFGLTGEIMERVHDAIIDMDDTLWRGWEPGHRYPLTHPEKVFEIEKAILDAHAILPEDIKNSKKWLLFYYRAVIDAELARNDFYRNEKILQWFKEMISLYHLEKAGFYVKPDIVEDEVFGSPLTQEELITLAAGGELKDIK